MVSSARSVDSERPGGAPVIMKARARMRASFSDEDPSSGTGVGAQSREINHEKREGHRRGVYRRSARRWWTRRARLIHSDNNRSSQIMYTPTAMSGV